MGPREYQEPLSSTILGIAGFAIFAVMVSSASCSNSTTTSASPPPTPPLQATTTPQAPAVSAAEYGNGLYYFPATGDEYIRALQAFYERHPTPCVYQGATDTVVYEFDKRAGGYAYYTQTRHSVITGHILYCPVAAHDGEK